MDWKHIDRHDAHSKHASVWALRGVVHPERTEKKLSKKVRNHQVMYTVTTMGKSTAQPPKNRRDTQLDSTECSACIMHACAHAQISAAADPDNTSSSVR